MLHNSDKEFSLTMGGGCGMLEGGRHGAGVEVQGVRILLAKYTRISPTSENEYFLRLSNALIFIAYM